MSSRKKYSTEFNKKKDKKMSIEMILLYCVLYKILSPEEAVHTLKTGILPNDIMIRLSIMENSNKN